MKARWTMIAIGACTCLASCRDAPPPPPNEPVDAYLEPDPPPPKPTPSVEPAPKEELPPVDTVAVAALCKKVIAEPLRDAGQPFLTLKERLLCEDKFGYLQQHLPVAFRKLQMCADWAHDSTEMTWCSNYAKWDEDAGAYAPPIDRP